MTIHLTQGNLLESSADSLVNTVNCVGVMGKGIALQFREKYPWNFKEYCEECKAGRMQVGKMFTTPQNALIRHFCIINFPTKQHWRDPSRLEWIVSGLQDLKRVIGSGIFRSIAIPALGCGCGGLSWPDVKAEIFAALDVPELADVEIFLFEPGQF